MRDRSHVGGKDVLISFTVERYSGSDLKNLSDQLGLIKFGRSGCHCRCHSHS